MAVEIPKEIFDYSLRSQIYNLRFSNQVSRDIIALLNSADKEIIAKLEATNGDFSKRRLEAVLKEIRKINAKTYAEAHSEMETAMLDFGAHVAEATTGMMATQLPMSWNPFAVSREQLQSIVSTEPIRVGEKGAMLLEELFQKEVADKGQRIMGSLRLGMVQGKSIDEMVRDIRGTRANQFKDGILEISRQNAAKITRSAVISTSNKAAQLTFQNNSDVVKGWIYCGTLDAKMCQYCARYYGQRFNLGEGPLPILHIACRCFQIPEIKTWKELGVDVEEMPPSMKASASGPVRADMDYQTWLKSQDKATQIDILGPNRQKLFSEGRMSFDSFVDDKGKYITLDELKQSHAAAFKKAFGA